MKFLFIIIILLLFPRAVYAYVDPGFMSILSQFLYVAFFGVLATFVFKPWNLIKLFFNSFFSKKQSDTTDNSEKKSGEPE